MFDRKHFVAKPLTQRFDALVSEGACTSVDTGIGDS
jgi:hypothetical protein